MLQALIHGLNRHYYSIAINYRKNELEQKMLMNLNKKSWVDGLSLKDYNSHCSLNQVCNERTFRYSKELSIQCLINIAGHCEGDAKPRQKL